MKSGLSEAASLCCLKTVSGTPFQEDAGVLLLPGSGVVDPDRCPSFLVVCRPVSAVCQNQHVPTPHTEWNLCKLHITLCHCEDNQKSIDKYGNINKSELNRICTHK